MHFRFAALVVLALLPTGTPAQAAADVAMLKARGLGTTGADLLEYLRKRTPSSESLKKLSTLVAKLDDDSAAVREAAARGLTELGELARPRLAQALKEGDAEVKRRARWALERIGTTTDDASLLPAVARVLASKKPDGALEALLAFVPHVEESGTIDDMALALPALAIADGKARPAALAALASPSSAVRGAVGAALARAEKERAAVQKLLADASPGVRRRVALALLEARDKEAIPALVALAGSDSAEDADTAEGALWALAGEKAPEGPAAGDPTPRATARKGWEKWWKDVGPKFDLAKADLEGGSGLALMGSQDTTPGRTRIVGLDPSGATRFTLQLPGHWNHASLSRRNRVLACNANSACVLEMDFKGKTTATFSVDQPLAAYRLRNGHLFFVSRGRLAILDRTGKELRAVSRPGHDILSATMFEDGRLSFLTRGGQHVRLDKAGKEIGSTTVGGGLLNVTGFKCHFSADGSIVLPDYRGRAVRAYDADGKEMWSATVQFPNMVTRLLNGHYLVGSTNRGRMIELDRNGKETKSNYSPEGRIVFFERR